MSEIHFSYYSACWNLLLPARPKNHFLAPMAGLPVLPSGDRAPTSGVIDPAGPQNGAGRVGVCVRRWKLTSVESVTDTQIEERFAPFRARMAGAPPIVINTFHHYYAELVRGSAGLIAEDQIRPVESLPNADDLEGFAAAGREALARTMILKLNGGLGTSMGLDGAKSLLPVREGLSFLDIIARQVLSLRRKTGCRVPLLFMNSFSTDADTRAALARYPDLPSDTPLSFLQNKIPKVLQKGLALPEPESELTWTPPGHGDLYTALQTSGILDTLLTNGYEYAFVSNSDNLGAVMDERISGYFAENRLPFLMEVADRTEADRKGGHLARRPDGRFLLREVAQCPPDDLEAFQDITRYRYFNTNSIWLNLPALRDALYRSGGILRLPLIRNSKTLDPRDPESPPVYQLETAMGAAIEVFEGAGAVRVPRDRFAPVKLCSDLLALWSDAYELTDEGRVVLNRGTRGQPPVVTLDPRFYRLIDDLKARFPAGAPSLKVCETFKVTGDVRFGSGIIVRGQTSVTNPSDRQVTIADGTILQGNVEL